MAEGVKKDMGKEIEIVWESGSGVDSGVSEYRKDGQTLVVDYRDGSTERYEYGNVTNSR